MGWSLSFSRNLRRAGVVCNYIQLSPLAASADDNANQHIHWLLLTSSTSGSYAPYCVDTHSFSLQSSVRKLVPTPPDGSSQNANKPDVMDSLTSMLQNVFLTVTMHSFQHAWQSRDGESSKRRLKSVWFVLLIYQSDGHMTHSSKLGQLALHVQVMVLCKH